MDKTTNIATEPGFRLLGCLSIRRQLDALAQHTWGARSAEDVEDVHQARVASRRLRAALAMFGPCFPDKYSQRWQIAIRKLTRGLGAARDLDVQILALDHLLSAFTAEQKSFQPGIKRLRLRLVQSRQAVQPRVIKVLDKLDQSQILAHMVGEIERALFSLRSSAVRVETETVRACCQPQIQNGLNTLLSWQESLEQATNISGHHAMRIAAKKLRYTLEICDPAFNKELHDVIKGVKRIQTLLGDIHDCDVWAEQVDTFMADERQKTIEYYGHDRPFHFLHTGLAYLRDSRKEQRQALFAKLVELWPSQQGLWEYLRPTPCEPTEIVDPLPAPMEPKDGADQAPNPHSVTG